MIKISITEKLWDGVRPDSVKKTGLSEGIRQTTKLMAKAADTPRGFDEQLESVGELKKLIEQTLVVVKKAKDDKKGAAGKLATWADECDTACEELKAQRKQMGLVKSTLEADQLLKGKLQEVRELTQAALTMAKDIEARRLKDTKQAVTRMQDFRNAMRDGLKLVQKDGFAEYIRTFEMPRTWGIDSAEVPMPPAGKTLKAELPALNEAAEKARIALEGLVAEAGTQREGDAAEVAKPLIKLYKEMAQTIKGYLAPARKLNADAHTLAEKFKALLEKGATADKLLPFAAQMHEKLMSAELVTLKEQARGRTASGDVQALRIKLRESLEGKVRQDFEAIASEEWNLIMVIFRETSEQISDAHRQVDRVLRLIGEHIPEAKAETDRLAKEYTADLLTQRNKFTK